MAHFVRTTPAPLVAGNYAGFRIHVRQDFRRCCAYCLLHEFWAGGERNFELDHFRPVSRSPELERDFYNLYYACHVCNQLKHDHWPEFALEQQGTGFVNLCRDDFAQHYALLDDGRLEALSPAADYTLWLLRLNSAHLVSLRSFAIRYHLPLDMPP